MNDTIVAVILAAGKGTRFQSKDVNKVALSLAGKPIILYSIELLEKLGIKDIFIVVGFAKESVKNVLFGHKVTFVEQKDHSGTANAVIAVLPHLDTTIKNLLIINGDDPFHTEESIVSLIKVHQQSDAAVSFTTSELDNPLGLGRIVRDGGGNVTAIIEEKDATAKQQAIKEVNCAAYVFAMPFLLQYLSKLTRSVVTGELYLTDLVAMAATNGQKIETVAVFGKWKGINTPEDLKEAEVLITSSA